MIKNYFKIAVRNILKNKLFSAINILGLSTGLACCILMFLFIQHELSYDKFHENSKNIYRLTSEGQGTSEKSTLAVTPAPWAPTMKKDFPEIKNYVRLLKDEKIVIGQPGEQHFYESDMLYADSTFFELFTLALEKGDVKKALDRPNSIILTEESAKKYFANTDPIGKTLEINSFGRNLTVEVTAIAKQLPANSHFKFNSLVSLQTLGDLSTLWSFHMFQSYVLLNEKSSKEQIEKKLPGFVSKYIINNPQADGKRDISLQPITDIHLRSKMTGEIAANGDITYVYVFAGVAIFILLIACFNFTNLSTARSLTRAKEVGLRKVVGAGKYQLMRQFLSETTLFALFALILGIAIAYSTLPLFNQLSGRELEIDFNKNVELTFVLISLVLIVGLLAGIYPAVILSAFKPVEVLKGKYLKSTKGVSFRKTLVTLQFVVSISLIASTVLVNQQLDFIKNKNLGFEKDNMLVISLPRNTDSAKLETFRNSLLNNQNIKSVTAASTLPGSNIAVNLVNDGNTDLSKAVSMQMLFTDDYFVSALNMKLIAGRDFSKNLASDKTEGFILNKEAVKKMGWQNPEQAVGKTIQWVQPDVVLKTGKVLGVVENFNITPLKTAVQPLVIHYFPQRFQYLYIKLNQAGADQSTALIEKQFVLMFPKQSFEYRFLDETLNAMYSSEKKLGKIFTSFSILAIIIGCLGVLGLSLYSIQQRFKEIGIRKVLGAGVLSITTQLVKEFLKPVIFASIIATPLSWYAMNKWLEDFAYRIEINWVVFLVTSCIVLVLAILTMSVQSIKAALSNPVESLRAE